MGLREKTLFRVTSNKAKLRIKVLEVRFSFVNFVLNSFKLFLIGRPRIALLGAQLNKKFKAVIKNHHREESVTAHNIGATVNVKK